MKKLFLSLAVACFSIAGFSQTGNNQIGVGADVGIPTGDFGDGAKTGFGGYLKGLYGIGSAGQITFTTGYSSFKLKHLDADEKANFSIIPLLAGYRHNFSGFYAEPQLGYGIYGLKYKYLGESSSDSEGAFTWAIGFGYAMNGLDIGARYQSASQDGDNIDFVGLHIGYNFSLGGK